MYYLFYQLHIVFFDLDADRYVREFPENILQQSDLPVSASAVAPCRKKAWKMKDMQYIYTHTQVNARVFDTHLYKMSPVVSPYTEAIPARVE